MGRPVTGLEAPSRSPATTRLLGRHMMMTMEMSSGSAYVFHYDGSTWIEQAKVTASDGAVFAVFGTSVSISGEYALVGADGDGGNDVGAAYVFHYDGSTWVEEAKLISSDGAELDIFGTSVSISGEYALVGAAGEYTTSPGSAYVFHHDGSTWAEQAKLTASDGAGGDKFGNSVSVSSNYAIVGTPFDDSVNGTDAGSAYVFHYDGSSWVELANLTASNGAAFDFFGLSVSISGNYAVVGANHHDYGNVIDAGSAYVFYYDGSTWIEQAILTASDGAGLDGFGGRVSVSGDYALIGAGGDDDNGTNSGSTYVYSGFSTQQEGISVEVTFDSTTVPVPPEGGEVSFEAILTNHTTDTVYIQISAIVVITQPDSVIVVPEKTVHFAPGETLYKNRTLRIPGDAPAGVYTLTINWVDEDGNASSVSESFEKLGMGKISGDSPLEAIPEKMALHQNYPNPFNPTITIKYDLNRDSHVSITVHNILGQEVATLVNEFQAAGYKSVVWDGKNNSGRYVASGVYICRMRAGDSDRFLRMLLTK